MINLVLIHIGQKKIHHLEYAIKSLIQNKNKSIYLLCDINNFAQIKNEKIKKKINFINIKKIKKNKDHLTYVKKSNLDKEWNYGFWNFTLERFFYLENICKKLKLKNVIHIENDNLIFENLDKFSYIFRKKYKIAYPLLNNEQGIGSLIYFKDSSDINNFCTFILSKFNILNQLFFKKKSDMDILFDFYKNNTDKVKILPTLSPSLARDLKLQNQKIFYRNFSDFNYLFDGAALGQKVDGVDRSVHNIKDESYVNEISIFSTKYLNIKFEKKNKIYKPFVFYKDKKYKILNLHIHSKNLKKFIN